MRTARSLAALFTLLSAAACGPIVIPRSLTPEEKVSAAESRARRDNVELVGGWMTGSFTSADQAASNREYFDVRLHAARLWSDRQDGVWLYIEQATASVPEKPYRQRIYRVFTQPNGLIVVEVYGFPGEPLRYAGGWRRPELFDKLSPKQLALKSGCEIVLKQVTETEWAGGTVGNDCLSDQRGATYATSEHRITPDGMSIWERGYDDKGKQVWGATSGPYLFVRE